MQKALMAGVTGACAVSLLASGFLALSYITLKGVSDLHPLGGLLLFACGPAATLFVLRWKAGRATPVLLVGAIVMGCFSASLLERALTSSHFEGYVAVMGIIGGFQGALMVMAGVWRVHRRRIAS